MFFRLIGQQAMGWKSALARTILQRSLRPRMRPDHQTIIKAMKLTMLLITIACITVSAKTNSQTVNFSGKNVPLEKVFKAVKKQTGISVFFKQSVVENAKPVSIKVKNIQLTDFLEEVLKNQPLDYSIEGKTIVIGLKEKKDISPQLNNVSPKLDAHPPINVRGKITNEKGEPVVASVVIKGSNKGTTSNAGGDFSIEANVGEVLVISSIGYANRQLTVEGNNVGVMSLELLESKLDQVQIVAYGTTTRRLNTGNVSTVKAVDIEKHPVTNVLQALKGAVPGLVIEQSSGIPGSGFNVVLRGQNSLLGFTEPFYVIDGVPYDSRLLNGGMLNNVVGNPFNYLNPLDIESIDILKDADATSIYGSRAANGAILITTKKGKVGATKVDIDIYTGYTKPKRGITMMNTQQYVEMRNEALKNDNLTAGPGDYDINGTWDLKRNTDWVKQLEQNQTFFTNAQASLSGGNTTTQYILSANYNKQGAGFPVVVKNTGTNEKANLHFNFNANTLDNRFKLSLTGNFQSGKNTIPQNQGVGLLINAPNSPELYNSDGSLNWAPTIPGQRGTFYNPLQYFIRTYNGTTTNLIGNAVINYRIIKGLDFKSSFGYTNLRIDEIFKSPLTSFDPGRKLTSGSSNFQNSNTRSWIIEPQLNYHFELRDHNITVLLGSTIQENINNVQSFNASGFSNDALLGSITSAGTLRPQSSINTQYKYAALFGRLGYNFQDKYLLNINIRRDGSSRFGPGKQFHAFASVGGAYVFSQENFFKEHLSFLSFGKIRASYGTTGSDNFRDYQFLDLLQASGALPYQGVSVLLPGSLFNPDLAWEETKKREIGLELGFLKDRIVISESFYRNRSSNQLISRPLSSVTGDISIQDNLAALVQNSGWEIVINTINVKSENLKWTSSFNISANKNKLVKFPGLEVSGYQSLFTIGQPLNIIRSWDYVGVNSTTGLYEFKNKNGDLTSTPNIDDRTLLINVTPKFFGGFQNNITFRNFSLDFLFQFVKQTGLNINGLITGIAYTDYNKPTIFMDRWQKPGDVATYQKFTTGASYETYLAESYASVSSRVYSSASYIRLNNAAFSWQVPKNWLIKLSAKAGSLFIRGENLFTITNYLGSDPETKSLNLPPVQVWTAGIRASF
jgi:TonB-dependent starch-binding outer membrane protein SusC